MYIFTGKASTALCGGEYWGCCNRGDGRRSPPTSCARKGAKEPVSTIALCMRFQSAFIDCEVALREIPRGDRGAERTREFTATPRSIIRSWQRYSPVPNRTISQCWYVGILVLFFSVINFAMSIFLRFVVFNTLLYSPSLPSFIFSVIIILSTRSRCQVATPNTHCCPIFCGECCSTSDACRRSSQRFKWTRWSEG